MPSTLPPELSALAAPASDRLLSTTLRLEPATLEAVDNLAQRLNGPTRGALLRYLVREGIRTTEATLAEAGR